MIGTRTRKTETKTTGNVKLKLKTNKLYEGGKSNQITDRHLQNVHKKKGAQFLFFYFQFNEQSFNNIL